MASNPLPFVSQKVKAAWLAAHPELYSSWPPSVRPCAAYPVLKRRAPRPPDEDPQHVRGRWRVIVAALKRDGLVSTRTYTGDVRVPAIIAAVVHQHPKDACKGCAEWKGCQVLHALQPGRRRRRTH